MAKPSAMDGHQGWHPWSDEPADTRGKTMITPDALVSAANMINREWGSYGYGVEYVEPHAHGSVLLKVCASDGSRFYVGSTRYGNTVHGEDYSAVRVELAAVIAEERAA